MISKNAISIFTILLAAIACFFIWSFNRRQRLHLLHKIFMVLMGTYAVWILALIGMGFTAPDNTSTLVVLDCITQVGNFCAVYYLWIAVVFCYGCDKLPRWCWLMVIMPIISFLVCCTNPLHHLQYIKFSIIKSEAVFGPFVMVSGVYSYICLIASIVLMINFARKNTSRLYRKQCVLLILGGLVPLIVSAVATLTDIDLPITATAYSFIPFMVLNGIAIYQLHLLDIKPVATQRVLDWISDCYLILSEKELIVSFNRPFAEVFAARYGIAENRYLKDCIHEDDVTNRTAIYNMMDAVNACKESQSTIHYEQAVTLDKNGTPQKNYYVTDVSPLVINDQPAGFVIIFKDITQLKKSLQQIQANERQMLEHERFAFLGQMMGGLAHNLKTPIMSISGSVAAADSLIDECLESLDDPVVTSDDFREIYGEIRDWFVKIQESTAYMSDIITAIKGQATNVSTFDESLFTLDELIKRTSLLMRHELVSSGCALVTEGGACSDITLRGDINNLVQVLGNLISNAIFAQKLAGGGDITVGMEKEDGHLKLYVKDTGPGIPENVRDHLFKEMVTSKGAQGSGLGLYISNAVVQGKFGGRMWAEDNPGGGAIIGLTIPIGDANQIETERGIIDETP